MGQPQQNTRQERLAPERRALGASLARALKYVVAWHGKRVVVKFGGSALREGDLGTLIEDVVLLQQAGLEPILVHGGGPEISDLLSRLGHESRFVDGLRVTDKETIEVVEMVLAGSANKRLVSWIQEKGGRAVGLSGKDGGLLRARPHKKSAELGFVGEVASVEPEILDELLEASYLPVIAPLGIGPGGATYNLNADTAAAAIAVAIEAEKFLLLTDVEGIYRQDEAGNQELISELTPASAAQLVKTGVVSRGMLPKLEACLRATGRGVPSAHILAAGIEHGLLVELFTKTGVGTMIRPPKATS